MPRQFGEPPEREAVEAADTDAVGVAGPSTAALGEEHDRDPQLFGHLEQPILLAVVLRPLRAGEHRVVVGHRHALGGPARPAEQLTVHVADTADESVGGGRRDQVLDIAPAPLRRDHERSVLDEGAGVDQIIEVLASCAMVASMPTRDRFGAMLVEADRVPIEHLAQVVAFESDRADRHGIRLDGDGADVALVQLHQGLPGVHRVTGGHQHGVDHASERRGDLVVHLHRLDERDDLAFAHGSADVDEQSDDGALQLGGDVDSNPWQLMSVDLLGRTLERGDGLVTHE